MPLQNGQKPDDSFGRNGEEIEKLQRRAAELRSQDSDGNNDELEIVDGDLSALLKTRQDQLRNARDRALRENGGW